jgi:Cysteine-rich CPXCG
VDGFFVAVIASINRRASVQRNSFQLQSNVLFCGMEEFANVQCPFCGQSFDVAVDVSIASQCFTTDCEVCCRPFEVRAECADGEITGVYVAG